MASNSNGHYFARSLARTRWQQRWRLGQKQRTEIVVHNNKIQNTTLTKPTSCDASVQNYPKTPPSSSAGHGSSSETYTRTQNPFQMIFLSSRIARSLRRRSRRRMWRTRYDGGHSLEAIRVREMCHYNFLAYTLLMLLLLQNSLGHILQMGIKSGKRSEWRGEIWGVSLESLSLSMPPLPLMLSWTLDIRFNHQNIHTLVSSTPYGD